MPKVSKSVVNQGSAFAAGLTYGVIAKKQFEGHLARGDMAAKVGSAITSTLASGGSIGQAASSATGVMTAAAVAAKAAGIAAVTAAAPFAIGAAIVGGISFGLYKIFED